jgi:uncharacterized protein YjlB
MEKKQRPGVSALVEKHLQKPTVAAHLLKDDGTIPNSRLPLLLYESALQQQSCDPAIVERMFTANKWGGCWRNGVYPYHHYHSTAHEVLACVSGSATIQFGGERGITVFFRKQDAVVIPAGVGHKNLQSSNDFIVVGAYPVGQSWDMNYGKPGERPKADQNIARVELPESDPLYGPAGPLWERWGAKT